MVELYVKKIREDGMSIEEVPKLWRSKVEKALEESGYSELVVE